ncbi:hypothetical protein [Winogradskyella immobilis]|uniref:GLPGLI family protein n=1 Tax=Winogradskyella immobilis TaxID=2816852 RepID=A0ABS8EPU3_9FLAO|nr:hypothetical protein [Winogradskyella immobilis]MCC1485243.1 hypothetical protein [Winogradskyella immobilis]MCG0017335.1 hypothetical protein [Winogradskyella immobilis]
MSFYNIRKAFFHLILLTFFSFSFSQNSNDGIYLTFEQFKRREPCSVENIVFKNKSEKLLTVNKIENQCNGYDKINKLIAITHNGNIYYNMKHNIEFVTRNRFSKLVILGRYCAFVVDESYPRNIQGQAGFTSTRLIGGYIEDGVGFKLKKSKIYFLDIEKDYKPRVLTRKRLKDLLSDRPENLKKLLDSDRSLKLYLELLDSLNKD